TSPEKYADAPVLFATDKGNKKGPYQIKKGDRIAQMVFAKYETTKFVMTESVETIGINREGGFGSTGV
ncbi:MAG: aminotransferase, partial [Clostridiales bacterium]|nr:aminotransferase [Clostridiales bacterium]